LSQKTGRIKGEKGRAEVFLSSVSGAAALGAENQLTTMPGEAFIQPALTL
jgi:hypothetical protein